MKNATTRTVVWSRVLDNEEERGKDAIHDGDENAAPY